MKELQVQLFLLDSDSELFCNQDKEV